MPYTASYCFESGCAAANGERENARQRRGDEEATGAGGDTGG